MAVDVKTLPYIKYDIKYVIITLKELAKLFKILSAYLITNPISIPPMPWISKAQAR